MKLIIIINNKGGVGKTTSAVNIASWFGQMGKKTLLADIDPSSSASSHLGLIKQDMEFNTICDYLINKEDNIKDYIQKTEFKNLWCLPSEPSLSDFYDELQQDEKISFFIKKEDIPAEFEYVIFDCPPNMGSLSLNALAVSDYALIPVQAQYIALSGLELTLSLLEKVRRRINPEIKILGLFGTHFDKRTKVSVQVMEQLRSRFGEQVFKSVIGINSKLSEAYNQKMPVSYFDKRASGSRDYELLSKEIIKRVREDERH
ncbi:MAG: ParA family protein [Calditrichaceae bacterium]